jgi:hypothetical protein
MDKLACDPTTHASRPTGDDGDSAFKSSHLSEDYDAFPFFEAVSEALGSCEVVSAQSRLGTNDFSGVISSNVQISGALERPNAVASFALGLPWFFWLLASHS